TAIGCSFQLWQIEHEDFRIVLTCLDGQACFVFQRYSVSGACGLAIDIHRSPHDLDPALAPRLQLMFDRVAATEHHVVNCHVLMDEYRAVAPIGRSDEPQSSGFFGLAECFLIISGWNPL